MKRNFCLLLALALFLGVSLTAAPAAPAAPAVPAASSKAPGAQLAQQVSLLTGIAISPLLGSSAYGCYLWWQAPEEKRASLPWFAQPWFWVTGLTIVGLCFIKDTAGNALPTVAKKPFDVIEAFENKFSGLLATGAIVPFLMMIHQETSAPQAWFSAMGLAALDLSWLYYVIIIPVAMIAFFFVFLASNTINVLILLSPFTTLDAALKGIRLVLLGTVVGTALVNPWIGAGWALVIILFSYLISGWSFRLSHFGTVYLWDFFTLRSRRTRPNATGNRMFLGRRTDAVPARTYGQLSRNGNGRLVFHYRPWLILDRRELVLPAGAYSAGRGLVNSEIIKLEGDDYRTAFLLPPRYRGHEAELVRLYQLNEVRPIGLRAMMKWLNEFFSRKEQPAPA
jgi:hypothetical protein